MQEPPRLTQAGGSLVLLINGEGAAPEGGPRHQPITEPARRAQNPGSLRNVSVSEDVVLRELSGHWGV